MKTPILKKIATLREQVFQVIVDELKGGQFAPGERITEDGLAKRLGVSRTPIREALGQLTKQGMLRPREGGGYVVPAPAIEEIRQIIVVRSLLEPAAVRMAAKEYQPADIERISNALESEARSASRTQPSQFAKSNDDFRHAIFDRINNRVLSSLIAQFAGHLHFIRNVTLSNVDLRHEIVERQRKIRDALRKRDGDAAENLWRSYLRFTEETMVNAMKELEAQNGTTTSKAGSHSKKAPKNLDSAGQ
jgi:DNA-binding GntR family transcriptional regulator